MDKIIKAMAYNNAVRIYVADATATVAEIKQRSNSTREVTAAVGRVAIATSLMATMESFDAHIYTRIEGNGPIGKIYADADAYGNVRAFATNPLVQLPANERGKLDVAGVVGTTGFLNVIKDLGLKEMFSSQTEIVSGEIAEDFTHYFANSQQTPSAVGLGVLTDDEQVKQAGGFILQLLPGTPDAVIDEIEQNLAKVPSLLTFLQAHSLTELLDILSNGTATIVEELPMQFQCTCTKERFLEAFASLPRADLEEMLEAMHDEEVICQYCGEKHYITNDEITTILNTDNK